MFVFRVMGVITIRLVCCMLRAACKSNPFRSKKISKYEVGAGDPTLCCSMSRTVLPTHPFWLREITTDSQILAHVNTWGVQVVRYPNFFSREWKQIET